MCRDDEKKSRKKIGILTWYYAMNHGARAHTYALLHVLRNMGYDAEIIAYQSWSSYVQVEPFWIISKNIPFMLKRIKYRASFKKSEKNYRYLSKRIHTVNEIDDLEYDLIILGSDEIFNINHLITSKDYTYFGVGIEKTPIITYAVSCGQSAPCEEWPIDVVSSVKRIRALSVRDINSSMVVQKNTGRTPEVVLDPTFLMDYSALSDTNWGYRNYILIYTFGHIEDYKWKILGYAKKNNLGVICLGNSFEWADVNIDYPSQSQWYAAFENAKLVITNSFHGTIFALKNKKPFIIIMLEDKVIKISNLLEELDIRFEDRLLSKDKKIEDCIDNELDFEEIEKSLCDRKDHSIGWLRGNIENTIYN